MADEPISVFISYSRTDSDFVDHLEADLQARNFRTWVDRRKLEGGQNWHDELEKAIHGCRVLLVVLSPEGIASKYVRQEYRYGQRLGKLVIPLEYQPIPLGPMDLNDIQWIGFTKTYEQGLSNLLVALSPLDMRTLTAPLPSPLPVPPNIGDKDPILVVPKTAPAPPDPSLNDLYRAGVTAKAEGNLERTATLWQQVLDRDPNFGNGALAVQMKKLMEELHPIRVQRLRERAEQAHRAGEWGQEIGTWKALLGLEPKDALARERIPIAEQNQMHAWRYENAQRFVKEGLIPSARIELEMLWQDAPSYGDPAGLAKYLGVQVPISDEKHLLTSSSGSIVLRPTRLTIGRAPDNQQVVSDPQVSGHHAIIRPEGQGYTITDLGSINGTYVNGQRLSANVARLLNSGDTIRMGTTVFTYKVNRAPEIIAKTVRAPEPLPVRVQEPLQAPPPVKPEPVAPVAPPPPLRKATPLPPRQDVPALPVTPSPTPRKPPRRGGTIVALIFVVVLILIGGGSAITVAVGNTQNNAHATATAQTLNDEATATATALQNLYNSAISGTPTLSDPLSDNNNNNQWTETSNCQFIDGAYHASETQQGGYLHVCPARATSFRNFAYQVQVTILQGNKGCLVFRYSTTDKLQYYSFCIDNDGTYEFLVKRPDSTGYSILEDGPSSAITTGTNQVNSVTVIAQGAEFDMYVNSQFVLTVNDTTVSEGSIGVGALDSTNSTEVAFSNAKVWML